MAGGQLHVFPYLPHRFALQYDAALAVNGMSETAMNEDCEMLLFMNKSFIDCITAFIIKQNYKKVKKLLTVEWLFNYNIINN